MTDAYGPRNRLGNATLPVPGMPKATRRRRDRRRCRRRVDAQAITVEHSVAPHGYATLRRASTSLIQLITSIRTGENVVHHKRY